MRITRKPKWVIWLWKTVVVPVLIPGGVYLGFTLTVVWIFLFFRKPPSKPGNPPAPSYTIETRTLDLDEPRDTVESIFLESGETSETRLANASFELIDTGESIFEVGETSGTGTRLPDASAEEVFPVDEEEDVDLKNWMKYRKIVTRKCNNSRARIKILSNLLREHLKRGSSEAEMRSVLLLLEEEQVYRKDLEESICYASKNEILDFLEMERQEVHGRAIAQARVAAARRSQRARRRLRRLSLRASSSRAPRIPDIRTTRTDPSDSGNLKISSGDEESGYE